MEASGDQSAGRGGSAARASRLRYPLRSGGRAATAAAAADAAPGGSATRRGKPPSEVSKSVCVLELSAANDKPVKPPRRHSIPTKPGGSPRPAAAGVITPVSGIRSRRSDTHGKADTPASDVSLSTGRRRFSVLSSVSYWMTQIKLAEAASQHSVSLGFFKLALQSNCEHVDRMREELKAYVTRNGLAPELEGPVKDVLQVYDIVEDFEKLKISSTSSQQSKDKKSEKSAACSATSAARTGNLKPRSLNSGSIQRESNKKEVAQKGKQDSRIRSSYNRNPARTVPVKEADGKHVAKSVKKPTKVQQEVAVENTNTSACITDDEPVDLVKEVTHEDKENMGDAELLVEAGAAQEI